MIVVAFVSCQRMLLVNVFPIGLFPANLRDGRFDPSRLPQQ